MRPVKSPPSLFKVNGCGVGMYGRRDFDAATGTYLKTRCACLVFVPVLPLDTYRVADAQGGGWYFIGREKPGGFVKNARRLVLVAIAGMVGSGMWSSHVNSPEYQAKSAGKKAEALVSQGKTLEAAEIYRGLLINGTGNPTLSREAIVKILQNEIATGDPKRVAAAVGWADKKKATNNGMGTGFIPDLADQALASAAKCQDPADAERILSSFRPSPMDLTKVHEALKKALEELHKLHPDDAEVRIKLALMREEFGEVEGALGLLEPAANKLGDGEGARLYGKLLLNEGRAVEALPHLDRYATPRLKGWAQAEKSLDQSYQAAQDRAIAKLDQGSGPPGFSKDYEAADEEGKQHMVQKYVSEQLRKDLSFSAAQERYQEAAKIVPTIMDLGVAKLRVAQAETDPAKRKDLLKDAEEAFLSLKSAAGESDEYRLFLGQIYFWSGRESEGRGLFDQVLNKENRSAESLYGIANVFRDLGEENDARKLLEEAYPKAVKAADKNAVAGLRALLARDTDEKITWLSKADSTSPGIAVGLAEARGDKAASAGDKEKAKACYREAIAGYEKVGRTASSLNNTALLYRSLYRLDGNPADFETSARLLSEAVELQPADSILSFNASESLLTAAALRVIGDRVHPAILQFGGGVESLRYLYQNESEKDQLLAALKADPNYRKSEAFFWDALLLAPKNLTIYSQGSSIFAFLRDEESLQRLLEKASEQEFDLTTQKESRAKYLSKEQDGETRDQLKTLLEQTKATCKDLTDPRAIAMSKGVIAATELTGYAIGDSVHSEEWLDDLKAAVKTAPCSGLQSSLDGALRIVALEKLAKDDPECAAIIEADRRLMDAGDILSLLIRARGELGERVRKHPAVVEVRESCSRSAALFPSTFVVGDWLMLDGLHPDQDQKLQELAKGNKLEGISRRLNEKIQPAGCSILIEQFWLKTLEGDEQGAKDLLPKLEAEGARMPVMF